MGFKERIETLSDAFETRTRDGTGESFRALKRDRPQWCQDVVREAHGGMMPDDSRYVMIESVVDAIHDFLRYDEDADRDAIEEHSFEACDGLVDVYTSGLTAWLASHGDRVGYVSQAVSDGLIEAGAPIDRQLAVGQFEEYREIYSAIVQAVSDLDEGDSDA